MHYSYKSKSWNSSNIIDLISMQSWRPIKKSTIDKLVLSWIKKNLWILCLLWKFEAVVCVARSPADVERITPRMGWFSQTVWSALRWPSHLWWCKMTTVIKMPSLVWGGGKSRKRLRNAQEQYLELNYFNKQTLNWPNMQCWTEADCRCVILVNSITRKQCVLHAAALNLSTVPSL